MTPPGSGDRLTRVLLEAQQRSLIGKTEVAAQVTHSEQFLQVLLLEAVDGGVLELGAGGGLPGLVLAVRDPDLHLVLLDAGLRATNFLRWAVTELELSSRVEVVTSSAETVGRDERYRQRFAAVVARSFGPPAVTAECGAPLIRTGGRLIVSEPPAEHKDAAIVETGLPSPARWPADGCAKLGLSPELAVGGGFTFAVMRQERPCPERFPRRPGIPRKRPLFP